MAQEHQLDVKDRNILAELDINARQSNNQIGAKVRLSKEVVNYRINRLKEKGIIIRFHTVINYFKLGIIKFKLYLRLTKANKEKITEIAEFFQKHHKTEWVALTTGRWDLIVGFLVHNVNEFDDEVQTALNTFSEYIQEKAVTTTLYLAHQVRTFLKKESHKELSKVVYHTSKDKQEKIDKIDQEIIKAVTNNARMPVTDIAKKTNTTARMVQYRLQELERKKIILAYKTHLEPKAMDKIFCKLIIYLNNTTDTKLQNFIYNASSLPGAIWPQRVLGNWDFEIDFELDNYDFFQEIIFNLKEKFPDLIKNHEFCITSKEFKLDLYPNAYPEFK